MADRPIIFSAPMLRALLDGRKSMTRRVLKPQPPEGTDAVWRCPMRKEWRWHAHDTEGWLRVPYAPGDRLWVREAFRGSKGYGGIPPAQWGNKPVWYVVDGDPGENWRFLCDRASPSIHMPRWVSRLTLHVTEVRVQRLQEIDAHDAIREGMAPATELPCGGMDRDPVEDFCDLWQSLHGEGSWDANPWVAAISFTVERANIDAEGADRGTGE